VNLDLLQQGLNRMKELFDNAITTAQWRPAFNPRAENKPRLIEICEEHELELNYSPETERLLRSETADVLANRIGNLDHEDFYNLRNTETVIKGSEVNGWEAMEKIVRGSQHIDVIHEVVKQSITEELEERGVEHQIIPQFTSICYPRPSSKREKKVPSFKEKDIDVLVIFGEGEIQYQAEAESTVCLEQAERSIVVGCRGQYKSVHKNLNTLFERAGAEPLFQRMFQNDEGNMINSVMGDVYILLCPEYKPIDDTPLNACTPDWNSHNYTETYIRDYLRLSNRPNPREIDENEYDWRNHVRYERAALIVADFSVEEEEDVIFYHTLEEMLEVEIISQEFYDSIDHDAYDLHLSPVNFARDLVAAHRTRWPDLYADAENQ